VVGFNPLTLGVGGYAQRAAHVVAQPRGGKVPGLDLFHDPQGINAVPHGDLVDRVRLAEIERLDSGF
jgi:hypothetical protein